MHDETHYNRYTKVQFARTKALLGTLVLRLLAECAIAVTRIWTGNGMQIHSGLYDRSGSAENFAATASEKC